jgi:glycosyltransferase involved in cell wall biosynthesis
MPKKRILLVSNTTQSFWIYRRDLIRHFIQMGYDVHCAAPPDSTIEQVQSLGATVHPIPLSRSGINPFTEIKSLLALLTLLRHVRPNIVFTYTIKPNSYVPIIARILSSPCISIVTGLGYSFISQTTKAIFSRYIFTTGLSLSTQIWVYNPNDQSDLIAFKKSITQKTSLIPGSGINISEFSVTNKKTPTEHPTLSFLMIARLLIDKGVREYMRAAEILKQQYPDIQCHLLGALDPGNPAAITQKELDQAIQSGTIHYHPETKDVRPFIANSDCIVLPSYREGIPKVLLEAGAMGKPSITTDVPGCRDVITHGHNGLIITARDINSLADTMVHFIEMDNDQKELMGSNARDHIVNNFSNESIFQKYINCLTLFLP